MKRYNIKKLILLFISVLLSVLCVSMGASEAFAAQTDESVPTGATLSQQYPDVYSAIVKGYENMEDEIDLSFANLSEHEIVDSGIFVSLFREVLQNNPQLFYVDHKFRYSSDGKTVQSMTPSYIADKATIDVMKKEIEASVQSYLSLLSDEMEDYEKALVLHDAIILNCRYYEGLEEADNIHNIYGSLCGGVATCQGYAYAYKYLLGKIGIDSCIVSSSQMNHAWNLVKIGGKYYHVDVTMDDPCHDKLGRVNHKYFLLSDSYITQGRDGINSHYGYNSPYAASDSRFDGCFWNNVAGAFNYSDGVWYYSDISGNIYSGTTENMKQKLLLTVKESWPTTKAHVFYLDKYVRTVLHDGYLYYNTAHKVYKVNPKNVSDSQVVYTNKEDKTYIFGIAKTPDYSLSASILPEYNVVDNVKKVLDLPKTEVTVTEPKTAPATQPAELTSTEPASSLVTYPSGSEILYGDVNRDGKINIKDATLVQMSVASLVVLDDNQALLADVSGDGKIKVGDATDIQKYVARIITEFSR